MKKYLAPLIALCVLAAVAAPVQSMAAVQHRYDSSTRTTKLVIKSHRHHKRTRKHHRRTERMIKHIEKR